MSCLAWHGEIREKLTPCFASPLGLRAKPAIMTINYAAPFPACDLYGRAAAFVNDSLAMGDLDE